MGIRETARRWAHDIVNRPRLLLGAKAAFAAAVSLLVAPYVPLADNHYYYYAPLGAVVSMYPTIARSAKSGLQALAGLVLGLALGVGVLNLPLPEEVGVALVVGMGVLIAGLRVLGTGASWVPISGLFVLLVGRSNPDDYSLSYLIEMMFGVLVGVAVNLLIFPPLYLKRAEARLNQLRDAVADDIRRMADAFAEHDPSQSELESTAEGLSDTARTVRAEVQEAAESGRGNPRAARSRPEAELNFRRLRALERIVFLTRDLADVLGRVDDSGEAPSSDPEMRGVLAHAMRSVADLIGAAVDSKQAPRLLSEAHAAVNDLTSAVDERAAGRPSDVTEDLAAADALRRMVDVTRPFAGH